eukprot:1157757-Pelagomonas_calceolata.AAC.16
MSVAAEHGSQCNSRQVAKSSPDSLASSTYNCNSGSGRQHREVLIPWQAARRMATATMLVFYSEAAGAGFTAFKVAGTRSSPHIHMGIHVTLMGHTPRPSSLTCT